MLAGPDVSDNNGAVTWSRVRLADHELAFAIAKSSEGSDWTDPTFPHNWHGIRERGLFRGAYHFARPSVSGPATSSAVRAAATAEAEHMLGVLHEVGGVGEGDLPPALDLEASSGLSAAQVYEWTETWVHVVEAHIKRKPIIYTGRFWKALLPDYTDVWGCPLWIAQWGHKPELPSAWSTWTLWQWTDTASVEGIAGNVDLSYFNGSHRELERLAGVPRQPARPHRTANEGGAASHAPRWPGRVLEHGIEGRDVRQWQEQMLDRGFVGIRTDGVFDERCALGCRWLQLYLGCTPTGRVDEAVWHATWSAP